MKKRFSERQIIKIIQEDKAGLTLNALCRKYTIAPATYYRWKNKFNGLTLSELSKLKTLETENKQLKGSWFTSGSSSMEEKER